MSEKVIAIISGRALDLDHPKSGEETFLQGLLKVLKEMSFKVIKIDSKRLFEIERFRHIKPSQIHLIYVPLKYLLFLKKVFPQSKFVYHVYYLSYATLPKYSEIKWRAGLISMSLFIDSYLATSPILTHSLRLTIPFRNIFLLEPYYKCYYCSFNNNYELWSSKAEELKHGILRVLYIGYINQWRFPYRAILHGLSKLKHRIHLIIYTVDQINEIVYSYRNITVSIHSKYLTRDLKCDIYKRSHFFLYLPLKNVAIIPPISLLEAVYHGVIPVVSNYVKKIVPGIPNINVVEDLSDLSSVMESLVDAVIAQDYPFKALQKAFQHYYDKERFLSQLLPILRSLKS
jgi:hypothetical protein